MIDSMMKELIEPRIVGSTYLVWIWAVSSKKSQERFEEGYYPYIYRKQSYGG